LPRKKKKESFYTEERDAIIRPSSFISQKSRVSTPKRRKRENRLYGRVTTQKKKRGRKRGKGNQDMDIVAKN